MSIPGGYLTFLVIGICLAIAILFWKFFWTPVMKTINWLNDATYFSEGRIAAQIEPHIAFLLAKTQVEIHQQTPMRKVRWIS